ncbi:M48 family metallopeptidase [Psychrobacter sp. FDAARGOS_221]|uniref:M48 family metallopeptidase n=1 Tax=Psychrobacter sp. FDAARGOS_221 TaxID=1975705 RepID=UPI000BB556E5|nr:M48 family metallopeptidase [Psychrobacter sp. FDAARGOS_221]PNK60216.1 M48 family peptidase [Psychrobacter sp. FDAARGOS_221]
MNTINKIKMSLLAATMTSLVGCATVADIAGYDTASMNNMAAKNYSQVVTKASAEGAIDRTSNTAVRVNRVFNRLKPYADKANTTGVPFKWEMTVIRSPELNAWAMPGGKMAVYSGIVEKLNLTDAEIAAVVGHEMAHALEEHSKKGAGQELLTGLAIQFGGAAIQAKTGLDAQSLSLISDLGITKPFSRSQESEADAIGVRLMAQAGYNPERAMGVWQKMEAVNGRSNAVVTLMSTHPNSTQRINKIQKLIPEVMPIYQAAAKAPNGN